MMIMKRISYMHGESGNFKARIQLQDCLQCTTSRSVCGLDYIVPTEPQQLKHMLVQVLSGVLT
jgi:hypothetical protein